MDVVQELSAASPPARPTVSSAAQPPAANTAVNRACAVCHTDEVIRQQRLTRAQWDREINKMTGWGAKVNGDDRDGILDYLFSNFGPRPRGR